MNRVVLLGNIPIFSDIDVEPLLAVAEITEEVSFAADQVVFSQGDPAHDLFVIVSGTAAVIAGGVWVASLDAGECFGELAILDRSTRTATIRATSALHCLRLARSDFEDLLDVSPSLAKAIMRVLTARLRECVQSR